MIGATDIEAIERVTVAAVSPSIVEELNGWLLPFDVGTIGRAKSAVPLSHAVSDPAAVSAIEERYRAHGLTAAFRISDDPRLEVIRAELRRRRYQPEQPTLVQITSAATVRKVTNETPADVASSPDDSWASVFVGEGFDPIDGVCRVKAFTRARDAVYASVREAGKTIAVGAAAFGFRWASVHGMRTEQAHRGRGLASRVLVGLAEAALQRGIDRVLLQVEEANEPARSLYRRAGFRPAWRYVYWRPSV